MGVWKSRFKNCICLGFDLSECSDFVASFGAEIEGGFGFGDKAVLGFVGGGEVAAGSELGGVCFPFHLVGELAFDDYSLQAVAAGVECPGEVGWQFEEGAVELAGSCASPEVGDRGGVFSDVFALGDPR